MLFRIKKGLRWICFLLVKSQSSQSRCLRSITIFPLYLLLWIFGNKFLEVILFVTVHQVVNKLKSRRQAVNFSHQHVKRNSRFRPKFLLSLQLKLFIARVIVRDRRLCLHNYFNGVSAKEMYQYILFAFFVGQFEFLDIVFKSFLNHPDEKKSIVNRLNNYRFEIGIFWMNSKIEEIKKHSRWLEEFKSLIRDGTKFESYRILDSQWLIHIGHVATLDFFIKYLKLYNKDKKFRIVAILSDLPAHNQVGYAMLRRLSEKYKIHLVADQSELERDYNRWAKNNNASSWACLSDLEKLSLIQNIVCVFEFPNREFLFLEEARKKVEKKWYADYNRSLLSISNLETKSLNYFLKQMGVPENAWYVCLHVRESSFYNERHWWGFRNASIADYHLAIKAITDRGGWVIRLGDPSMTPLTPMRNVVDYVHSSFRSGILDLLLIGSSRFYLGTSTGLSCIPELFGVPSALTNFLPIGFSFVTHDSLVITKLFYDLNEKRLLSVDEIFDQGLGFHHTDIGMPERINIIDNSPEEIYDLTIEMLSRFHPNEKSEFYSSSRSKDSILMAQHHFETIVEHYGGTAGSLGTDFVNKYSSIFLPVRDLVTKEEEKSKIKITE